MHSVSGIWLQTKAGGCEALNQTESSEAYPVPSRELLEDAELPVQNLRTSFAQRWKRVRFLTTCFRAIELETEELRAAPSRGKRFRAAAACALLKNYRRVPPRRDELPDPWFRAAIIRGPDLRAKLIIPAHARLSATAFFVKLCPRESRPRGIGFPVTIFGDLYRWIL